MGELEDLWIRVRNLIKLADKATVTITGLRDAEGCEVVLALQFELGECVGYSEGPPPAKEEEPEPGWRHFFRPPE